MSREFQLAIKIVQQVSLCTMLTGIILAGWDRENVDLKWVQFRSAKRVGKKGSRKEQIKELLKISFNEALDKDHQLVRPPHAS